MAAVKIGNLKSGKMYAETPEFNFAFKRCMNSIGAEWKMVGDTRMWVFKPEHADYVQEMAQRCYADGTPVSVPTPRELSAKEQYAVAMGLGLIPQEDLE